MDGERFDRLTRGLVSGSVGVCWETAGGEHRVYFYWGSWYI